MADKKDEPEFGFPHPVTPDRIFDEILELVKRVEDGHSTPETTIKRIIEQIGHGNMNLISTALDDANLTIPCNCWDL